MTLSMGLIPYQEHHDGASAEHVGSTREIFIDSAPKPAAKACSRLDQPDGDGE